MCGITAGIAQRDVAPILLEGLKRLEYRGYDSAGVAIVDQSENLKRIRICGKVAELSKAIEKNFLPGHAGVAHTRWATHGCPSEDNAHPHMYEDSIALVHNGIIENYQELKKSLIDSYGLTFSSDTDTEVIVKLLGKHIEETSSFCQAVKKTVAQLKGAYALAVISKFAPDRIIAARKGSPLVIGVGIGEHFLASDPLALLPVTQKFVVLEEGDVAEIFQDSFEILNVNGEKVEREIRTVEINDQWASRGEYRHFMQKEIYEQPEAISAALEGRISENDIDEGVFGVKAQEIFSKTKHIQIVACGTSFHAGLVAKYWIEANVGLPCSVEIASEMRYRKSVVQPGTLLVALSQSGETADTLAAFLDDSSIVPWVGKLAICNVPESSLVREADLVFLTHAGPEIGVASTKAFTTQLVGLLMLVYCLAKNYAKTDDYKQIPSQLRVLPALVEEYLNLNDQIESLANEFEDKIHSLFLGRGIHYPIALEGALKLKEISYIHAEAYPAGELKHGPLALVDKHMPVVALVPNNELLEKIKSNLEEVAARGGKLILFVESGVHVDIQEENTKKVMVPSADEFLSPIVSTVLMQLLAYHVAVIKGTDVDQPRNLAKSVTVE
jgi:glucosamine--fructose-6-phosphate aminotransferase (isomerizing)